MIEGTMAKHLVNLDALIQRADFEISSDPNDIADYEPSFSLGELEKRKNTFGILRKPDFQRETKEWRPEQIVELVKNFCDRELIPAIILWRAPSRLVFVIDGAHRLSALMAWVNDDYGDGIISQRFFGANEIPISQRDAAARTRELIREQVAQIGDYKFLENLVNDPDKGTTLQNKRGRGLTSLPIATQSISGNDPQRAEASFYRINQGGAVINDNEKEIIRTRRWPEAVASRALLRAGTGHKYWSAFGMETQINIEGLAKSCFDLLYQPELSDTIRTLELPIAGRGYTTESLGLLHQFVAMANDLKRDPVKTRGKRQQFEPLPKIDPNADETGDKVIAFLEKTLWLLKLISSNDKISLGLHPAVYSYTSTGKFLAGAFFAEVLLVKWINSQNEGCLRFTELRGRFEDFIVKYKHFINQIIHDFGAGMKSAEPILHLYRTVLDGVKGGLTDDEISTALLQDVRLSRALRLESDEHQHAGARPSRQAVAAARLRKELENASRCPECNARIYSKAYTTDHEVPVEEGGLATPDNLQPMHPFCNSGHKTHRLAVARRSMV